MPTRMVDVPGPRTSAVPACDIPLTLGSGQHAITVDGTTVSTVQIYNPDDPPSRTLTPAGPGGARHDRDRRATRHTAVRRRLGELARRRPDMTVAAAGIAALAPLIWAR
ncbi:hypothetical protein C9J85_03065 [Haloferax sp. wsp5]|nr:hypothetical protein C9J85_03065 [Haloferax sp. wsp5]